MRCRSPLCRRTKTNYHNLGARLCVADVQEAVEVEGERDGAGAEQDDHDGGAGHHLRVDAQLQQERVEDERAADA